MWSSWIVFHSSVRLIVGVQAIPSTSLGLGQTCTWFSWRLLWLTKSVFCLSWGLSSLSSLAHPSRGGFGPWIILSSEGKLIFSSANQRTRCNSTLLTLKCTATGDNEESNLCCSQNKTLNLAPVFITGPWSHWRHFCSLWASCCFGIVVATGCQRISSAAKRICVFTQGTSFLCPWPRNVVSEQPEVIHTLK